MLIRIIKIDIKQYLINCDFFDETRQIFTSGERFFQSVCLTANSGKIALTKQGYL